MASNARNLANLLGTGETTISASKLGDDVPPGTEDYLDIDSLGSGSVIGETAFVQGSNRLYLWNGSGWYNIGLINTTPTWDSGGQPLSDYTLDRDSPQDATVITLAASDPEGLPISYSYVTGGSMDSMATISQDSSVFTITPKTVLEVGENVSLTGSITFRASDGINILPHISSFTLSFIIIVENSRYTSLLIEAVDTSDNNNITDASSNNMTITTYGDAYAGTFSPYRHGGYSTYFDGTGDYLIVPDDSTLTLTGDQTIEAFVYLTAYNPNTNYSTIVSKWQSNSDEEFVLAVNYTSVVRFFFKPFSGGSVFLTGGNVSLNTWTHIAVVRSGDVWAMFVDGNRVASQTSFAGNYTDTNSAVTIGSLLPRISGYELTGYISDVRLVKGTAVYSPSSTTLTVPTKRLTAIANTSLLTCHLPYWADGSSNSHSITVNGNTSVKPFTPYDNLEYSAADHGGSIYFDGSGDNLSLPFSADTNIVQNNDDFTIEAWVYPTSFTGSVQTIVSQWGQQGITVDGWILATNTSGQLGWYWGPDNTSTSVVTGTSNPLILNSWNHVAVCRTSGSHTIYVNGNQAGTFSSTSIYSGSFSTPTFIGYYGNGGVGSSTSWWNGYISDLRFVKGTAVYTGNFTQPTAPLTAITNTSLHLKGTDASIIDKSQKRNIKLVGNTTGSTTQVKFANTKSIYFDGTGDYITTTIDGGLGSGDFTIEFWLNTNTIIDSNYKCFFSQGQGGTYFRAFHYNKEIQVYTGSTKHIDYTFTNFQVNTWYHFAIVATSSNLNLYIDGTLAGSVALPTITRNEPNMYIGGWDNNSLNGYLQDFRITKGLARYTANFTPPTAPLEG